MSRSLVRATTPIEEETLAFKNPPKNVAGLKAVTNSFKIGIRETGVSKTLKTMRAVNRFDGFDCPGCAWPDPDNHRSGFEFCENGAKAFATEATNSRVTPQFFTQYSVSALSEQSDMWLDKQGRITNPMFLDIDQDHYVPIQWEEAFDIIANFAAHKHVRSEKDHYSIEAMLNNNVVKAKNFLDIDFHCNGIINRLSK